MGRKLITQGIEHTAKKFDADKLKEVFNRDFKKGFQLVYGDSVTGDEPLLLRDKNGEIKIKTIESLCKEEDYFDYKHFKFWDMSLEYKLQAQTEYEVWTSKGWSKIKRVIKHKCNKKIYRVWTPKGVVDVTEDHSLLDKNLKQIKPENLKEFKTELSHTYPNVKKYNCLAISGDHWSFSDKLSAAKMYYSAKKYNLNVYIKKDENKIQLYKDVIDKIDADDIHKVNHVEFLRKSVEGEFVYDLETEYSIFQCGVGEIQVKNTDSFMGCFPELTISESWKMIDLIQVELDSGIFPEPIHLEFECMYGKYFQLSKKCYVSWMMEPRKENIITDNPDDWIVLQKIQKGVVSSRRDNCRYTTQGFDELMDMAAEKEEPKNVLREYVADYAYKLMSKGVELRDLIVTKGVGNLEDYEKEDEDGNTTLTNQGHIKLAAKMKYLRDEDVQNTRLQFVFIRKPGEKIKFADLKQEHVIEDAIYFKNNFRRLALEPNYLYYLTHTIESHFDKILDYKDKPKVVVCEKIIDKLEKEREILENKIHPFKNTLLK